METMTWIKTKDTLPKMNEWCFFYYINDTKPLIGCYKGKGVWLCTEDNEDWMVKEDGVTHWMPLPKPPKQTKTAE